MKRYKIVIIGSGFAGLSAACFLSKAGYEVHVLEKHAIPGGRARAFSEQGFTFDMGPSWYWMPDVFDRFFGSFGHKVEDYYQLERLNPSYRVYWEDDKTDIPADYEALKQVFEKEEPGSGAMLDKFMQEAEFKYRIGMQHLVYKSGRSLLELIDPQVIRGIFKLDVFKSMRSHLSKYFKSPRLRQIMEFPTLFLGSVAQSTPALYSLMNYADVKLGTWYPTGGMYKVVEGIYQLAKSLGVEFHFNTEVKRIKVENYQATAVETDGGEVSADIVIGAADYHHVERNLLPKKYRSYTKGYWKSRKLAPSCLIFYVGLNKKLKNIKHHSLFFDTSMEQHAGEIYQNHRLPKDPLFYVSATSQTDESVAPVGAENLFILMPVSTKLPDLTIADAEHYFGLIMQRMEQHLQEDIDLHVVYKRVYRPRDFQIDYNAFKGNAYGLANVLSQTANLKPSIKSLNLKNLYFAGQLTVPGPGVPPALISGEVVANLIMKDYPI